MKTMHSGHVVTKPLVGARFIAPRMVAGAPWHMTWRGGCAVACNGRQLLRIARDDFDFARLTTVSGVNVQIEPGATDMERDAVLMANLPAVVPFDRAGTLLVTTAAYNVIGDPGLMFDTNLTCTAHDADGRALGDVSLYLPVIHFEGHVNQQIMM